jgi:mannose-6-phosphate isomerase
MNNYVVNKPWGHEIRFAVTDKYIGKILYIAKGKRLSRQYHEQKDETIFILEGSLILEIGMPKEDGSVDGTILNYGDRYRIKPGTIHRFSAPDNKSVTLVEVSTAELDDVVRLEDDYNRV